MRLVYKCTNYFNLQDIMKALNSIIIKMKKALILLISTLLFSCATGDDTNNPILHNPPVNITLNLNLPLYQDLQFDSTSAFIENQGIKGIIVYRFSENSILAWDAACPHLAPSECTAMTLVGVKIICSCDESEFSILNGSPLSGTPYPMKQYRATYNSNNTITITNF